MADRNRFNKNPDNKKRGFPATFLLFLVAVVLIVVTVQNFMTTKHAAVGFSHQVEHLENLNLISPEESRKVSLKENLVTFSGKFRETQTEEGKARFRYLQLLETKHDLTTEQEEISNELDGLANSVQAASSWFLALSGTAIPANGYQVVGDAFDFPERKNAIVIAHLPESNIVSLTGLTTELKALAATSSPIALASFETKLLALIGNFRSPVLGIGKESLKQELKALETNVVSVRGATTDAQLATFQRTLLALSEIVATLNRPVDHIRLSELRSVRLYKDEIERYQATSTALEQNKAKLDKARTQIADVIWFFNNEELSTRALERQDPEKFSHWFAGAKEEWEKFGANKGLAFKAPDQPRNLVLEKTFKSESQAPNYFSYLFTLLPIILIVLLLYFVFSRQMRGMGGGAMNFGKSPAKLLVKGQHKTTFKDVAGIDEAKEELSEIVDFLKNPTKFTALGGRIPKGVLCIGPPGTGKTLIAKAVAGEADRPFFSIAGSDFVEMFVGVGASRIRDMFDQAKKNAPCIIFIDEIDAVGRHRGAGVGGGHDEREQTLNQLLVEMDGFDTSEGVILMAATNRPDVLDKALLRPGRFDRRVVINLPDIKGRFEILKVKARKIKIDPSVDLMAVARSTPGASGADLENLLNEAALLAARQNRTAVTSQEILESRDKVLFGKERRSLELDDNEKRTTAYHESGHAMVGLVVEHSDPVDKVTIIPRGLSLGATHFLPKKNRVSYWKKELVDQLAVLMGGRVAEEIFLADVSSGAQQDIAQATDLARSMVCRWGMSDLLGTVAYDEGADYSTGYGAGSPEKNYSEETAKNIDHEVRSIVEAAYKRATEIILANRERIDLMAQMLIEFETLDAQDIEDIKNDIWDAEKKKTRSHEANNRYKRIPPTPPPLPQELLDDDQNPEPEAPAEA